jgi:hypothetical protein
MAESDEKRTVDDEDVMQVAMVMYGGELIAMLSDS